MPLAGLTATAGAVPHRTAVCGAWPATRGHSPMGHTARPGVLRRARRLVPGSSFTLFWSSSRRGRLAPVAFGWQLAVGAAVARQPGAAASGRAALSSAGAVVDEGAVYCRGCVAGGHPPALARTAEIHSP